MFWRLRGSRGLGNEKNKSGYLDFSLDFFLMTIIKFHQSTHIMITLISWTTWKSWREFKSESREINKNSFLGMLKLKSLLAINWCYQIVIWNYAPAEMSQSFSFKIQLTWVFFKATREQSETRSKIQKFAGAMQIQLNVSSGWTWVWGFEGITLHLRSSLMFITIMHSAISPSGIQSR